MDLQSSSPRFLVITWRVYRRKRRNTVISVRHTVCKARVDPKLSSGFTKLGATFSGGGMAPGICIEPIVDLKLIIGDKSQILNVVCCVGLIGRFSV